MSNNGSLMDAINERTRRQQQGYHTGPVRLQEADPWDKRTGISLAATFEVTCLWTPVNDGWATVSTGIELHDGSYRLSKDAEIARVAVARGITEHPEIFAIAWTKKVLSNGGAHVLGLYEANPGHITYEDGSVLFKWFAQIGSRLSLAVVRLSGELEGQARVVPVE